MVAKRYIHVATTLSKRQLSCGEASVVPVVVSRTPVPEEAFNEYAGMWIAVREGIEIVAAADSLDELRENPAIVDTDAFFHVPEAGALFF
ncbi:MAG TPA: hypothetical protein VLK79_01030 [Gaiellales bacterium]|nr:hypothetical protein [Gaiellales bacterium]